MKGLGMALGKVREGPGRFTGDMGGHKEIGEIGGGGHGGQSGGGGRKWENWGAEGI